ncbi:MAG: multidrug ABC transporter ATP-binding protein [Candidatus Cloacimonadota bacterium]|nr:MAG: multidrug ABC transporter ATP-binding protein [Candidatus Cloacimonadota bacterium]
MKTFEKVMPIVKKTRRNAALGLSILLIVNSIQLTIPKIIQHIFDGFGKSGYTHWDVAKSSLLIAGLALAIVACRFFWRILIIGGSWLIDRDLRDYFYKHLMLLPQNFFNKSKTGDLMAHATNDINALRMLFGMGFIAAADSLFLTVASLIFLISINLRLTLLVIIPLPILSVFIAVMSKKIHHRFLKVQNAFSFLSGTVQENISGIRVVKSFAQEDNELERMSKASFDYLLKNIDMVKINGLFNPVMGVIISGCMGFVLIFGGRAAVLGKITVGEYIAFFSYLGMMIWPMIAIGWIVDLYQRGTASLKRLNRIFFEDPEITDEKADFSIKELSGNISVKNLSFRYNDDSPQIFKNISLEIKKGETLAIAGRTGCGKTSFIDLLTRIYEAEENTFFLDGHDLRTVPLDVLRSNIVTVPQDIFLFSDTVYENIKTGNPDASDKDAERVAKIANVYDDIIEFSDGFNTVIGERGVTLSGGQKQRIAIARAFLSDPEILILDDSLSAVDTKTESNILDRLIQFRKNKTNIIIAHRISSIQHADKIIVLEDGVISESGTHEELLKNNKLYKDIFEKQQLKEKLEEN